MTEFFSLFCVFNVTTWQLCLVPCSMAVGCGGRRGESTWRGGGNRTEQKEEEEEEQLFQRAPSFPFPHSQEETAEKQAPNLG